MLTFKKVQKNNPRNNSEKKWYARAVVKGTLSTNELAEEVQRNCSMKPSDVHAVIRELSDVMTDKLQEGYRVKLDGLGSFKLALRSKGEVEAADLTAKSVTRVKVLFQPETRIGREGRVQSLVNGCKLVEAVNYNSPTVDSTDGDSTGGGTTGGGSSSGGEEMPLTPQD